METTSPSERFIQNEAIIVADSSDIFKLFNVIVFISYAINQQVIHLPLDNFPSQAKEDRHSQLVLTFYCNYALQRGCWYLIHTGNPHPGNQSIRVSHNLNFNLKKTGPKKGCEL